MRKKKPLKARQKTAEGQTSPLSQPALQVLLALADGDKHGWAILKDIERFTEGEIQLSAGTLYGLVKRLFAQGLIEESPDRPPFHWDDQRRRYYRLTEAGRAAATKEIDRLESMVAVARSRKLQPRGAEG